ncbi:MucR family transcriptional regulator [Methylobacterium nodulans]|uniref:Transcriptional regulator, MucR family n=1 Tax=Methylobacterium nodulans (strain LMG 21967 / CNCM I-2342 / ORS 2060) TaxID=460265 RepID=B8IUL7_METNO|nr:MucR family transcriptional regulator [Methylobacterium nodulans]ACL57085.1 transcriptional regulator, MucR family [Methylobacterium nodulans ORS 2060]
MSDEERSAFDGIAMAADIVSAYVSHNNVPPGELTALIRSVYDQLGKLGRPAEPEPERPVPPVPIRKSVTPGAIISLEDGKPYKSLKRHLRTRGLTPQQYRQKWDLPPDYPMVAADYAARRSELAKANGLGRSRQRAAEKRAAPGSTVSAGSKKEPGRPRKSASTRR